jgi:hypothetical protein
MPMKSVRPFLFFLTVICLSPGLSGQQEQDDAEIAATMEKSVTVHAEVVGQIYCRSNDEEFVADLNLRLRFVNVTTKAVIFSRKVESPSTVRAARNVESASHGEFLYSPNVDFFLNKPAPDAPSFGLAPSPELFVILAPGQSFEARVRTSVFAATDSADTNRKNGLLAKGSYVLQVGIRTWPYDWPDFTPKIDTRKLKMRWAKYGELATGFLYSDFAPLTIPGQFEGPSCH